MTYNDENPTWWNRIGLSKQIPFHGKYMSDANCTKTCTKCCVEKSTTEFYKRSKSPDGFAYICKDCDKKSHSAIRQMFPDRNRERCQRWKSANIDKKRESDKRWYKENSETVKQYKKKWYALNADRNREKCKLWREMNADKKRTMDKKWKSENPHKVNATNAKRRAAEFNATPLWANRDLIALEYELAAWCAKVMGEPYHVDHEIPLQHKLVCGLHVETNLRVIRGVDNCSKQNRFEII